MAECIELLEINSKFDEESERLRRIDDSDVTLEELKKIHTKVFSEYSFRVFSVYTRWRRTFECIFEGVCGFHLSAYERLWKLTDFSIPVCAHSEFDLFRVEPERFVFGDIGLLRACTPARVFAGSLVRVTRDILREEWQHLADGHRSSFTAVKVGFRGEEIVFLHFVRLLLRGSLLGSVHLEVNFHMRHRVRVIPEGFSHLQIEGLTGARVEINRVIQEELAYCR